MLKMLRNEWWYRSFFRGKGALGAPPVQNRVKEAFICKECFRFGMKNIKFCSHINNNTKMLLLLSVHSTSQNVLTILECISPVNSYINP